MKLPTVGLSRSIVLVTALVAAAVGPASAPAASSPTRPVGSVRPAAEVAAPKKAVIVVGPVCSLTSEYLKYGRAIADAAEAQGMQVVRIFHPYATWKRVVAEANGADLFVYAGHGNGWPSQYSPFQEDTKDGLGLNPSYGETDATKVRYRGADWIRQSIRFAPNAVVILSHLSYASGNASSGMPIPTRRVALKRVDNYASGFLYSGARTIYHLGSQPGENIVDALFEKRLTMDGLFMMGFGGNQDGSYASYFGWIGWKPDLYFDSVRSPGARIHLDPDPTEGYLRAVTGDLGMTTEEWLGSGQ